MNDRDDRAKLFLPFAALEGLEELLFGQESAQSQEETEQTTEFSKKVQKNNADTC